MLCVLLGLQLMETGLPMVVALNMCDLLEQRGIRIDTEALSRQLGCPVVTVSALKQTGIAELVGLMLAEPPPAPAVLSYAAPVEKAVAQVMQEYGANRFEAIKMLEGEELLQKGVSKIKAHALEDWRMELEAAMDVFSPYQDETGRVIHYRHHETWHEDNGSSHIKAALLSPFITIPFVNGKITIGPWQNLTLVECDTRDRVRDIVFQVMGE